MRPTAKVLSNISFDLRPLSWLTILTTAAVMLFAVAARAQDEKIIVSHGFSTFGELKYPADFTHFDYTNPDAPKGGEISTWERGSFDSLHRFTTKGETASSGAIFFESLMVPSLDEPDSLYGLLAETIEYPESRQWAIFNLRKEATFSDGTPLTADDVVFSYNILLEKGLATLKTVFVDVTNVEALDPHRVKFTFAEGVNTRELPALVATLSVFSEAWWSGTDKDGEPRDFADSTLEAPLGSGPYVLDEMDVGRRLVYKLNPDYWGKDLAINAGQNNFEKIRYEFYADPVAGFEGFKSGTYHFRTENSSKDWATGYNFPAVSNGWVVQEEIADGSLANAQSFIFNLRNPKFQDPKVREAIGMMFNFEWSNKTLFFDLYARVESFWGNSTMEAKGAPTPEELAVLETVAEHFPASLLTDEPVVPAASSPSQLDRRTLRAASKLLDEAGWAVGSDGVRRKDGEVLSVSFMNSSPLFDRIINPYVENLKAIGIDARLDRIDTAAFYERIDNFDFEMMTQTFSMGLTPGIGLRQWFSSSSADIDSGYRNLNGLKNPGIDILVDRIIASETRDELEFNVRLLDRALRSLKFWVPQWFKDVHTVAYWDLYARPDVTPLYALGAMSLWWYDAEKAAKLKAAGAL